MKTNYGNDVVFKVELGFFFTFIYLLNVAFYVCVVFLCDFFSVILDIEFA